MDDTHFTAYVTVMQLGQSFFIGTVKPPVALCFGVRFVCPEPVLSKWSVCFIIYRKPQPNQHNTTLLLLLLPGVPGEPYQILQSEIRKRCAGLNILLAELCNQSTELGTLRR
jgi:hypothetical protein